VFKNAEGRQVIILVTDGYDEHSRTGLAYALKRVKELNATIFRHRHRRRRRRVDEG
jgi:hypothetical protein